MGHAIYCKNGHFLDYESRRETEDGDWPVVHDWEGAELERKYARLAFCSECGAKSVMECAQCQKPIVIMQLFSDRPSYCSFCGKPFPWTETALQAAAELTDELDDLNTEDKIVLKGTFLDLTVETPRTHLAATRFKRIMGNVKSTAGEALRKIIVDVASETAVKLIKGS